MEITLQNVSMDIFSLAESFKIYTNPGNIFLISASQFLKKNGSINFRYRSTEGSTAPGTWVFFQIKFSLVLRSDLFLSQILFSPRCRGLSWYVPDDKVLDKEMSILKSLGSGPWIRASDGGRKNKQTNKNTVLFLHLHMRDPGVQPSDTRGLSPKPRCLVPGQPPSNISAPPVSCFSPLYWSGLFHSSSWAPDPHVHLPFCMDHRELNFSWTSLPNLHHLLHPPFLVMV